MVFYGLCIVRQGLSAPAETGSADQLYKYKTKVPHAKKMKMKKWKMS